MNYLAGRKIAFYDAGAQRIRLGEVRLHQGKKILVLTGRSEWKQISIEDVKKVYDGGKHEG